MDSPWDFIFVVVLVFLVFVVVVVVVGVVVFVVVVVVGIFMALLSLLRCWGCGLCNPDSGTSDEPSKPYPITSHSLDNEPESRTKEDFKKHASGSHGVNAHGRRSEGRGRPQEGSKFPTPSHPYPQTSNQNKPKSVASEDFREHTYVNISEGPPPLPPRGNMPPTPAPLPPQSKPSPPTSSQNEPMTMVREDHEQTSASHSVNLPVSDGQRSEEALRPQPGNMTHAPTLIYPILPSPTQPHTDLNAVARPPYKEANVAKLKQMREHQAKWLRGKTVTANDLGFSLLIGVDANPSTIGGYCVQLQFNFIQPNVSWAETYSYNSSKLPWILNDKSFRGDSGEFEMKNLFFALLLWQSRILKAVAFAIYTDNWAIEQQGSTYGMRVRGLLHHLTDCKGAVLCDRSNMFINSRENPEHFARCIQPADDLSRVSRENLLEAETFLTQLYGVPIRRRSHVPSAQDSRSQQGEVSYKKTPAYKEMLEEVKEAVEEYQVPCQSCNFCIEETGSLESIAISIR